MSRTRKTVRAAKEPEIGSDEWHAREQEKPGFALGAMKDLCVSIAQGDASAVGVLERWMRKVP